MLPSLGDLKFSNLNFDKTCAYLNNKNAQDMETRKYMYDLKTFYKKIEPFVNCYKRLINSYNNTMHNILEKEINLLLPPIPKVQKHGIITTLVSSFIGLAYEGISIFLHNRWNKALHKAVNAMDSKANIQQNKLMQLENSMLMYGVYNAETLEKLIATIHNIHNTTSSHERLFTWQHSPFIFRTLYGHSLGLHHYSTNSLLYLRTIQDKYIALYRELITQLCIYASGIRVLAQGYLPNTLITPVKLKEIWNEVRKTLWITNPDYDLVIYYTYIMTSVSNFWQWQRQKSYYPIPGFYTAIYPTTLGIVPAGNCASSYFRPEWQSPVMHPFADQETIYHLELKLTFH